MTRYLNWWQWGYLSATGECFDIGMTVRQALAAFLRDGEPFAGSSEPNTAGNGSLMRLAPVVLYYVADEAALLRYAADSSRTTHGAPEAVECCVLFAAMLRRALLGQDKASVLSPAGLALNEPKVRALAEGVYRSKARSQVIGSGYSVASLEAALWCFHHTDSYHSAVLEAANLGDDADTTAAIVGQLAGAFYGLHGIPQHWRERLYLHDDLLAMADGLYRASQAQVSS
ncbi:MAG: ADP-ribosyl-[dinitrogen reductase] glycohydrolase [Pseudomonas citronellolis]|nr:MAG: ADP-ribosyl-[dinitrogen reductase] glycohydrolase [Pseudomonas citronellolis]